MSRIVQLKSRLQTVEGLDSPLLRWALVVVVAILLWSLALLPYLEWRQQHWQQIERQVDKASRLEGLQSSAAVWRDSDALYAEAEKLLQQQLFAGSSYVTAQTALLTVLRELVQKHQLKIESQSLHESESVAGIGQGIPVSLRLHGEPADALGFIVALAEHPKLLSFDSLYIAKERNGAVTLNLRVAAYRVAPVGDDGAVEK